MLVFSVSLLFAKAQSNYIGPGIAMSFNGSSSSYVDLGDSYNSLTFPFSFEVWTLRTSNSSQYPGIFGCDNEDTYYGFWIRVRSTGTLEVEFGNGMGAGSEFRRGFRTTNAVPLNKWFHLAVVCNSVSDVHIYINGVDKNIVPTEGTSTLNVLTHSTGHANLGRTFNLINESNYLGIIDEARLWNVSRSETQIRDFMCKKMEANSTGLIGYWKADESYASNTVMDFTTPSENGIIVGSVPKITSGAALGDTSIYLYASTFTNDTYLSLFSPSGERCGADTITGNPYGLHIYRVDSMPYNTTGLSNTTPFYFGVFCAESNNTAHYSVFYRYKNNNGLFNPGNESDLALMYRMDASESNWLDINQFQNPLLNRIKVSNQTSKGEYILNLNEAEKLLSDDLSSISTPVINVYPNPAQNYCVVETTGTKTLSTIKLFNLNGELLLQKTSLGSQIRIERGTLPNGCYLYKVTSGINSIAEGKIIFQ